MNKNDFDEEEKLREFLKQNRPLPPLENPDVEQKLLEAIETHTPPRFAAWVIPSTIAASIVMLWGGYRLFSVSYNNELEAFMLNSWNYPVNNSWETISPYSLESDWLYLSAPYEPEYMNTKR